MAMSTVKIDAIPCFFNEVTKKLEHPLDPVLDKLTIEDFRSLFFLLIDVKVKKEDFLKFWIKKDKHVLRIKFINIYNEFRFKDAFLIEIFGTMQKYDLLSTLGTCDHVFKKDKDTFTQLSSLWKFLYTLCEQIQVGYLKQQLFPENLNINVCCVEELICLAFVNGKLDENSWQEKLTNIFKSSLPSCLKLIDSYKCSNLDYYPLRRPTKDAPCGIAVILNHVTFDMPELEDRPESFSDANALKELWNSFGFKTVMHTDLTALEVFQLFQKLAEEDHSKYDAFVACILSHGDEGIVVAKDGTANKLSVLVDLIANGCETLVGKPKLFFIQACQGQGLQTGFRGPIYMPENHTEFQVLETEASLDSRDVPLRSDVLVFNSSIEGFASVRGANSSWFVDALVSNIEKYAEQLLFTNILNKVKENVSKNKGAIKNTNITNLKQTPVRYDTLRYELKLKKVL